MLYTTVYQETKESMINRKKILLANWLLYPLLFVLGVATGLLVAGYAWSKSGYQYFPSEIIVQPPPPNATWCFPNTSLRGAEKLRAELAGRLRQGATVANNALIIATVQRHNDNTETYRLVPLEVHGTRYEVLAQGNSQGDLTLATEKGSFYLHQIPERFHEKYDSLVALRN